ncbi:MAG: succinate dehydrogenase, cytochrome b556 subunit [Candidatus Liberibacter ctenarytainae]|uniref:Succinate dehydrogenase cytochrome b556 subunit n=1 Tax=Candidatus Liberibacter ctenarytainae TaxID=2020335 RepID=A0A937AQV6_9HYPH|nr:succinate dehydrogenase, cytochrome b556 subunit [Candidatus Liberibacter ctenarytainae]
MSDMSNNRPLSPHLQIYRLIPTMFISIVHRITGVVVYFGAIGVVIWFLCVAEGSSAVDVLREYTNWFLFKITLFLYSWAVIHHMLGGIRYLFWDSGFLLDKNISTKLAKINIIASILIVIGVWVLKYTLGK